MCSCKTPAQKRCAALASASVVALLLSICARAADTQQEVANAGFTSKSGQEAGIFAEPALSAAPADTVVVEGTRIDLVAGTEAQEASITFGSFAKNRWRLQFTTPLDKESKEGQFANLDGLTNATRIALETRRYSFWSVPERTKSVDDVLEPLCRKLLGLIPEDSTDDLKKIRAEMLDPIVKTKDSATPITRPRCATGYFDRAVEFSDKGSEALKKSTKELREQAYQELAAGIWFAVQSLKVTGGRQSLEYVDPGTATKQTPDEDVWSAEATASWYKRKLALLSVGARYERAFKSQQNGTVCPPSTGTPVTCVSGPVGPADEQNRKILFTEIKVEPRVNERSLGFALAPRVSYEFEGNDWGIDLPIYLLSAEKGGFVGGLRVGYNEAEEDDKFTAGIFVGKKFVLLGD
jgi:hypothetical protein